MTTTCQYTDANTENQNSKDGRQQSPTLAKRQVRSVGKYYNNKYLGPQQQSLDAAEMIVETIAENI